MTGSGSVLDQRYPVAPPTEASLTLRDGTRLDADIYHPQGPGPFPVLLQRQAYSRRIGCTICYAHPAWYAAHGFIVVVQDIRGRGTSEGIFRPGEHEIADGAETVQWAAALPGSNGRVGMYGFSYQAYNQWLAAAGDSPALAALAPAMGPWNAGSTWMFQNGAVRMKQALGWGAQITADAARRAGDAQAFAELQAANGALPINGPIAARPHLLEKYRTLSHFMDWLETPIDSPFWAIISPAGYADAIRSRNLPMLFIGGWFDTHLSSVVEAWRHLIGPEDTASRLIIGPWLHFPWVRRVGALDFGPAAGTNIDLEQVRFFRLHLTDSGGVEENARIRLFDMGRNDWAEMAAWPASETRLRLGSSGRASIDVEDGILSEDPSAAAEDYIVHDPWRPAPVTGGCYGVPPGPVDRSTTDERSDVLTFTTTPFKAALTIAGDIRVELEADCDRASFDLHCVLSRVAHDGRSYQLSSGHAHFREKRAGGLYVIPLDATMATVLPGEQLRLSISAAAYPAYPINPGTGEDPVTTPKVRALVTTIRVTSGGTARSALCFGQP